MSTFDQRETALDFILKSSEAAGYPDIPTQTDPFESLVEYVEWLIAYRMDFLLSLLYRLDVTEISIKQALHPGNVDPPARAIANLIIQRQLERIATRQKYSDNKHPDLEGMDW